MPRTLQSLLNIIPDRQQLQIEGDVSAAEISFITDDSRKSNAQGIFSATKLGEKFIQDARDKGTRVFLIPAQMTLQGSFTDCVIIRTDRLNFIHGFIASELNGNPSRSLYLVGITGTNGKTTASQMIYHIWKCAGIKSGVIGTLGVKYINSAGSEVSYATGYTTPRSGDLQFILATMVKEGVTHVVLEASSEALFLGRLEGCEFSSSVFINLTPEHLNFHGDMEQYFQSKMALFNHTKGRMIVYSAGEYGKRAVEYAQVLSPERTVVMDKPFVENIPSPVLFNRVNASLAVLASFPDESQQKFAAESLRIMPEIPGRFNIISLNNDSIGIVDYAHTPDALENILTAARELGAMNVCVVFGCGGDRDREKRPIMGEIASRLSDLVIVTDDNPRTEDPDTIRSQIIQGAVKSANIKEISDRRFAIRYAAGWLAEQTGSSAVIVAGKGHENVQIFSDRKEEFNDTEILREEFSLITEKLAMR